MGLFTNRDTPVIWRGPMATKLIQQFLGQVDWGELDYLLIDLPPGTGDVQLTLTQSAPLVGAVIVTTPQEVAVGITMRGLRMFEQVNVPILGVIENMSGFICSHCGGTTEIFGEGGGRKAAAEAVVPFLGSVPLDAAIVRGGDEGRPVVADAALSEQAPSARVFIEIAGRLAQQVSIVNEQTESVKHHPSEVAVEEEAIRIRWSDGIENRLRFRDVRLACPCAACVDEITGERRLDPETVPGDVRPIEVHTVGRYALKFDWSDGHGFGIYRFDLLRSLAEAPGAEPAKRIASRLPIFGRPAR